MPLPDDGVDVGEVEGDEPRISTGRAPPLPGSAFIAERALAVPIGSIGFVTLQMS